MKSMTGFGAASVNVGSARISINVKSLNSRFLEVRVHAPRQYAPFENQVRGKVSEMVHRGHVEVFISRRGPHDIRVNVNRNVAKTLLAGYRDLAKATGMEVSSALLVRLVENPQVVEIEERDTASEAEKRAVTAALERALRALDAEKVREGRALSVELGRILTELKSVVRGMRALRERANNELERKIVERLEGLGLQASADPARISQELIFHLDRSDIREEMARLDEHLVMCEKMVKAKDVQGKKLDFYSQELLREVNTIGSKSNLAKLTEYVVEAKTLIESFKEQVQNIE